VRANGTRLTDSLQSFTRAHRQADTHHVTSDPKLLHQLDKPRTENDEATIDPAPPVHPKHLPIITTIGATAMPKPQTTRSTTGVKTGRAATFASAASDPGSAAATTLTTVAVAVAAIGGHILAFARVACSRTRRGRRTGAAVSEKKIKPPGSDLESVTSTIRGKRRQRLDGSSTGDGACRSRQPCVDCGHAHGRFYAWHVDRRVWREMTPASGAAAA
jgi:hypothetical protein